MQGVGKTTLGTKLKEEFNKMNVKFESISLDDYYLTYEERNKLNKQLYPYRGPPGTHDVQAIISLFKQFKSNITQIQVPIFNKALHKGQGDRDGYRIIDNVDILMFEGWFVGYTQVDNIKDTQTLPNNQTYNFELANYMNQQLQSYQEIRQLIDYMVVIQPVDYSLSLKWRLEAEQQMIAKHGSGMTESQIVDFVSYFWNCLHPSIYYPTIQANSRIQVNSQRQFIYQL